MAVGALSSRRAEAAPAPSHTRLSVSVSPLWRASHARGGSGRHIRRARRGRGAGHGGPVSSEAGKLACGAAASAAPLRHWWAASGGRGGGGPRQAGSEAVGAPDPEAPRLDPARMRRFAAGSGGTGPPRRWRGSMAAQTLHGGGRTTVAGLATAAQRRREAGGALMGLAGLIDGLSGPYRRARWIFLFFYSLTEAGARSASGNHSSYRGFRPEADGLARLGKCFLSAWKNILCSSGFDPIVLT